MKNKKEVRKRFYKPYHFLNLCDNQPSKCLAEVFQSFHLDDFRQEINLWQQVALSNDQSAYDGGNEREDLIEFIHELHKVIEAFNVINERINQRKIDRYLKLLSKDAKKLILQMNKPVALSNSEKEDPKKVIESFRVKFKFSYAKIEILDLLDAVITYAGNKKVYSGNLILFYQHVNYLIRLAYSIPEKISKNKMVSSDH